MATQRMATRRTSRGATLVVVAASLFGIWAAFGVWAAGPAQAADGVTFSATLDDRPVERIDSNTPLVMRPDKPLRVSMAIKNATAGPVDVRAIKVDGQVLNMSFFSYATRIDRTIDAGKTERATFSFDADDLGSQATGLLPARLQLLDKDRNVLAEQDFPVDVRGSMTSTYGVFGIIVALITLLLLGSALVRLAMRQLPENRWFRATRFAVPGIGIGMTLTFTLSALRVLVPGGESWLALVVLGGLVGLVVGFFTPGPSLEAGSQQYSDDPALTVPDQSRRPIDLRDGDPAGYPASDVVRSHRDSPAEPDPGGRSSAQF